MISFSFKLQNGQTALPVILLISTIVVEIAITGALVSYFATNSVFGERLSARALAAANLGVKDAEIKIVRNKDVFGVGGNYNLTIQNDAVSISVLRVSNSDNTYTFTIEATGVAGGRQKKLIEIIVVNQTTGRIDIQSTKEKTL